ncbi:hypothetical protein MRB53_001939 [Persea americana]|uniref:Uncharacterized protein n=1 Tax=Persea americana TaxID=3435 RepID=A0ACC2MTB4_PERAE|nr:hypothetical protein MRB53_001939 [Persea americana]
MESNRKRRGFMKGKLMMSSYRASKTPSSVQFSSKIKQSPPASTASVGFHVDEKKFAISSSPVKQMPSVIAVDGDAYGDFVGHVEGTNGAGASVAGDESVDLRAATYISYVQERFRLERGDSRKYQETQARNLH